MSKTRIQGRKRLLRTKIEGHLSHGIYTRNSGPFQSMARSLEKLSEIELDALAVLLETATTIATHADGDD